MSIIYGSPLFLSSSSQNADLPPLLDKFKAYAGTTPPEPETITLADIPVSDAETETIVNLKESDGKLHPYLYLSNNHNNTNGALLLRKNIGTVKGVWTVWNQPDNSQYYRYWCEKEFFTTILDPSVSSQAISGNIKAHFTSNSDVTLGTTKCFALSLVEYGLPASGGNKGPQLPYFSSNSRRIAYNDSGAATEHYTRSSVTATGFYIDTSGTNKSDYTPVNTPRGLRPAIFLPFSFKLIATANEDGSYDMYDETSTPATFASPNTIGNLSPGDKLKIPVNTEFQDFLGDYIVFKVVDQNHNGYPLDSTTLCSDKIIAILATDAKEPTNGNGFIKSFGNGRFGISNIKQWLNSKNGRGLWYSAQSEYDAPPAAGGVDYNAYNDNSGFLSMIDQNFVNMLIETSVVCGKNKDDGNGSENVKVKMFLPSMTELGLGNNGSIAEGIAFPIFSTPSARTINTTQQSVNNSEYKDSLTANLPFRWSTRTQPASGAASNVVAIDASGNQSEVAANHGGSGIVPFCNIPNTTAISTNTDSDGCYTLDFSERQVKRSVTWKNTKDFHIRQFTYNFKKQYQTMLEGAVASVIVEGAPANVTDFQITGSGANPVLSWVNPIDDELYQETVVIQKQDSEPTDITDGTEIYRGTDETCTATGLEQSTDYYFAIYTVSSLGVYKQPVVKSYRFDFPEEPTEYLKCTEIPNTTEYEIPENGWFRIDAIGGGGTGGTGINFDTASWGYAATCGGGGIGGHSRSEVALNKGDILKVVIDSGNVTVSCDSKGININALRGSDGNKPSGYTQGSGGLGGEANGGNIKNDRGQNGNSGHNTSNFGYNNVLNGGEEIQKIIQINRDISFTALGGKAVDYKRTLINSATIANNASLGSVAKVFISRGNTNIASPSQASAFSILPKNNSVEATWENSGDPVQIGTMLVYNTSHTPKSPSDGVAADIPLTQPVTLALNSNSKELQEDFKKQSYTITGVPNDKPVFVALFPYDKDRKYGLAKQEVEIPREHSWYDKQQELEAEVETVKAEMADYQSYYTTTQEVLK